MNKVLSIAAAAALMSGVVMAKEVKIGVVLPLTGPIAAFGQTSKGGLDIAYEQNSKLKIFITFSLFVQDLKNIRKPGDHGIP